MSESKVVWHSIKKEGLSPNDCDAVRCLFLCKPLLEYLRKAISRKASLAKSTHK
nr:MAG TPA: hypothetical protein [Caudoviricetes sp.]